MKGIGAVISVFWGVQQLGTLCPKTGHGVRNLGIELGIKNF